MKNLPLVWTNRWSWCGHAIKYDVWEGTSDLPVFWLCTFMSKEKEKKNQCQAIRHVFEPVGPTLFKNPLGAWWMSMWNLKWWVVDNAQEARVGPSVTVMILGVGNHGCMWRVWVWSHVVFRPYLSLSVWNNSRFEININRVQQCVKGRSRRVNV